MSDASDLFGLGLLQRANLSTRLDYVHRNIEYMLDDIRREPTLRNKRQDCDRMQRALERLLLAMPGFIHDAKELEEYATSIDS